MQEITIVTKIKINNTLTYKEIADLTNQYNSSNEGLSTYVGYIPMEGVAILGSVGTSYEIPPLGTHNSSKIGDFRKNLRKATGNGAQFLLNYGTENIEKRTNLGDPGGPGKSLQSYSEGCYYNVPLNKGIVGAASKTSFDKINWSTIYNSSEASTKEELTDLIQFRIGVINNDVPSSKTYMHFRAFLDQISDSYNANWDATKYIGRGRKRGLIKVHELDEN